MIYMTTISHILPNSIGFNIFCKNQFTFLFKIWNNFFLKIGLRIPFPNNINCFLIFRKRRMALIKFNNFYRNSKEIFIMLFTQNFDKIYQLIKIFFIFRSQITFLITHIFLLKFLISYIYRLLYSLSLVVEGFDIFQYQLPC